jgi:hypothetical protein
MTWFRKLNWSTLIAAIALFAGLVFNGLQIQGSSTAQRQARVTTELGILTQLQGTLSGSIYRRVPYAQQFQELRLGRRAALTAPAYQITAEEAADIDYFAWLFNNHYLTAPGSEKLWGPRMICEYQHAFAPAFQEAARDLPDLIVFIRRRGPSLAKLERC